MADTVDPSSNQIFVKLAGLLPAGSILIVNLNTGYEDSITALCSDLSNLASLAVLFATICLRFFFQPSLSQGGTALAELFALGGTMITNAAVYGEISSKNALIWFSIALVFYASYEIVCHSMSEFMVLPISAELELSEKIKAGSVPLSPISTLPSSGLIVSLLYTSGWSFFS